MKKIQEYRRRATECRELSVMGQTPPELREHYESLAAMWDRLVEERLNFNLFIARDDDMAAFPDAVGHD